MPEMNLKDPMDDRMSEELSSFADAEISERDLGRWVARVTGDQEARGRFSRYRLIGAQLAAEDEKIVNASSIADKVSQALLDEPTVLAPRNWRKSIHFPRMALGAALAAGVAVVAVALAPQLVETMDSGRVAETPSFAFAPQLSVPADGITMVALGPGTRHPANTNVPLANGQRWKVLSPSMQQKLSRYLLEHNEVARQISAQQPSAHLGYISSRNARP